MSDDIVDRLRDRAHRVSGDSYALPKADREAMTDAADEIERLRALVARYEAIPEAALAEYPDTPGAWITHVITDQMNLVRAEVMGE